METETGPVMADQETIRKHVSDILDDSDLKTVTSKKVRQELEKRMDTDLTDRKKELDEIIMEVLEEKQDEEDEKKASKDDDDYQESEEEIEDKRSTRKKAPAPKPKKRKARGSDSEEEASDSDDDYSPNGKKGKKKKRADSDDGDSDGDWRAPRKAKSTKAKSATPKAKKAGGGGGGGKGYTKTCTLSPELASLMGQPEMARHEVVKKMWQIIKEKNLYDPKNKQFAICNEELLPVIGQKRFRTFGMMKQLSKHFRKD